MDLPDSRPNTSFSLYKVLLFVFLSFVCFGLLSVLFPSRSGPRRDLRRIVGIRAQLDAMGKGLEMFQNDFNEYPDSSFGADPIDWSQTGRSDRSQSPPPPNGANLSGAHWLARALIGHDLQGVDTQGMMLKRTPNPVPPDYVAPKFADFENTGTPLGQYSERKSGYVDPKVFAPDDDAQKFPNQAGGPRTGRLLIFDIYGYPILYYRAKPRNRQPVSETDGKGIYNQGDNAALTGGNGANGWDFAGTGHQNPTHCIGCFSGESTDTCRPFTDVFTGANPDSFVLISAGKDGIYGTQDDVTNITPSQR